MSEYLDRKQVIELYEKYQPSLATHVYEFGEKLKALPTVTIPVAELGQVNIVIPELMEALQMAVNALYRAAEKQIDVEPVIDKESVGMWIDEIIVGDCSSGRIAKCSKCGFKVRPTESFFMNYCPNCGQRKKENS